MKSSKLPTRRQTLQAVTQVTAATLASAALLGRAEAGSGGAFLLVTHKVEDYDKWLPVFEGTAALKKKFGWKQSTVYSVDGDRNNVMVMEEFASLEKAKAFAASPELKAAMGKAGVAGAPEIRFVSPVSHAKA
jgi:quinol monooxygenase YgiN